MENGVPTPLNILSAVPRIGRFRSPVLTILGTVQRVYLDHFRVAHTLGITPGTIAKHVSYISPGLSSKPRKG